MWSHCFCLYVFTACLSPWISHLSVPCFCALLNSFFFHFLSVSPYRATSALLTFHPFGPGGVWSGGMAEAGVGTCPQVFVVDSQANYISMPGKPKQRWKRLSHRFLLLLVGLAMMGLIVQGYLIYNLYQKTEVSQIYSCVSVKEAKTERESRCLEQCETPSLDNFPIFLLVILHHGRARLTYFCVGGHTLFKLQEDNTNVSNVAVLPFPFYRMCKPTTLTSLFWDSFIMVFITHLPLLWLALCILRNSHYYTVKIVTQPEFCLGCNITLPAVVLHSNQRKLQQLSFKWKNYN